MSEKKNINKKIVAVIDKEVEEHPDKDFMEILYDLDIVTKKEATTSETTYKRCKFKNNDYLDI